LVERETYDPYRVWTPRTDAGNAEAFARDLGDLVRYDHARGRWLIWDSHRWRPDGDATVYRLALRCARNRLDEAHDPAFDDEERKKRASWAIASESRLRLDAMLGLARTVKPIADDGEGWDSTPGLLGAPNGVVDLRTGELRDGRPEDRITKQAGVDYDPGAGCPRWERFLLEVLGDAETVAYVKRLAGYALTGEATEDRLVFLMGVGGNGKTTLIEELSAVAGDYAQGVSPIALLSDNRSSHSTELADLEGSRLATCEELGDARLNAERIKLVSGGGRVTARRMRRDTITFPVTWQLFFSTNGLPRADDNSWSFWRRVVAVDFPNVFTADADPGLTDALRDERAGILRWAVEGAVAFYRDGLGELPAAVAEKTAEYREDVDPLEAVFEAGYLIADPGTFTSTADLYQAYLQWAQAVGVLFPVGEDRFAKDLAGRFTRKRMNAPNGGKVRGFVGVAAGPRGPREGGPAT
jgi:putative DNA primase/helicase